MVHACFKETALAPLQGDVRGVFGYVLVFNFLPRLHFGIFWCQLHSYFSPLKDPRPPAPELPDQFIEEHVEMPSQQEAPLPDTILGGGGVTLVHSQASRSPLAGTTGVSAVRKLRSCRIHHRTSVCQKLILKYFLDSGMQHHSA